MRMVVMIVMIEIKDNKILPNMFLILYRNLYFLYICRSLALFNLFWQLFGGKSLRVGKSASGLSFSLCTLPTFSRRSSKFLLNWASPPPLVWLSSSSPYFWYPNLYQLSSLSKSSIYTILLQIDRGLNVSPFKFNRLSYIYEPLSLSTD